MMRCERCGAPITEGQIFCPTCGIEIQQKTHEAAEPVLTQPGMKREYAAEPVLTQPGMKREYAAEPVLTQPGMKRRYSKEPAACAEETVAATEIYAEETVAATEMRAEETVAAPPAKPEPVKMPEPVRQQPVKAPEPAASGQKSKKGLLIGLIAAGVAVIAAVVLLFVLKPWNKNKPSKTAGTTKAPAPVASATATDAPKPETEPTPEPEQETELAPDPIEYCKVAMITDFGDIADKPFNRMTYEGCKEICEANDMEFTYKKPASDDTAARISAVEAAIDEGCNVIVMPSAKFVDTIVEVAPEYPDVKFIALDVSQGDLLEAAVRAAGQEYDYNPQNWDLANYADLSNVYCAVFQEEICGYMAGYAAVRLGYRHLGFLGGMALPAVIRYGYGFVQGADTAAVELGIANEVTVEYVYGNQFYGDADITAYMDTWYQIKGVEVVFACGGDIYTSVVEAAKKVNGKIIGVDGDQSEMIAEYCGVKDMTVTSAMKGLTATVKVILNDVIHSHWSYYAGRFAKLGLVSEDPTMNFVQLPMDTTQWNDGFTQDDYRTLVARIFTGELTVSNNIRTMPATEITVNEYGTIK